MRARPGMPSAKEAVLLRQALPETVAFTDPGCEERGRMQRSMRTLDAFGFCLPDGTPLDCTEQIEVDVERCAAVEPLFSGDFGLGKLRDKSYASSLAEAILEAASDLVLSTKWTSGGEGALPVIVVGGISSLPGFRSRLARDVRVLASSDDNHYSDEMASSLDLVDSDKRGQGKAAARVARARTDPRFHPSASVERPFGNLDSPPCFADTAIWRGASIRAEAASEQQVLGVSCRRSATAVSQLTISREEYEENGCAASRLVFQSEGYSFW